MIDLSTLHILSRKQALLMCVLSLLAIAATGHARAEDDTTETASQEVTVPADFDWSQLDTSSPTFIEKKLKPGRKPGATSDPEMSWKRDDKGNGASAVTVKQPITSFWDTRVGADMNVVTQLPTTSSEVLKQKIDNQTAQSSGSAWAAMTAPGVASLWDKTTIEEIGRASCRERV